MSFQGFDLKGLADLLRQSDPNQFDQDDSDDNDELTSAKDSRSNIGPGAIGVKKDGVQSAGDCISKSHAPLASSTDIWGKNEIVDANQQTNTVCSSLSDPRKTPTYDMYYRQCVTSEDVFLQMGNKTPGSASCENLVVEIHLPNEEDFNKIQLNLQEQAIDLRSPHYYLYLGLPHPINTKAGNAAWNKSDGKLIVTLVLARELDRLNF